MKHRIHDISNTRILSVTDPLPAVLDLAPMAPTIPEINFLLTATRLVWKNVWRLIPPSKVSIYIPSMVHITHPATPQLFRGPHDQDEPVFGLAFFVATTGADPIGWICVTCEPEFGHNPVAIATLRVRDMWENTKRYHRLTIEEAKGSPCG